MPTARWPWSGERELMTEAVPVRAIGPVRRKGAVADHRGMRDVRTLEAIGRADCLRLLAGAIVGRMVFTEGALPAVVPVTFAVDGDSLVCRTTPDSRLARAADGGVLALEADELDVASRSGWSVVATGLAEVVTAENEVSRVAALVQPWAPGDHQVAIRLRMTVLSGRRVGNLGWPAHGTGDVT
jgi:uncharacterized protein